MSSSSSHEFQPASPTDLRSCCPALNALAAHGYLPRSGRNITFLQLINAIREVYNTSLPLATLLSCAGFLTCDTVPLLGTIDLHSLARHGRIEHDASLAHADAELGAKYAPTEPDELLLAELLGEANGKGSLTLEDFARVRSRRETALGSSRALSSVHAEITRGEVALILKIMGDGEKVSTEKLGKWMGEDRLPDGWKKPERTLGLVETVGMARRVEAAVRAEQGGDKNL